jgi:putative NIF3 family GTP cyclohydrolase 1 type 2
VIGQKQRRLKLLLGHDINLFGYHLPLDSHPELGNNAQLAKRLDLTPPAASARTTSAGSGAAMHPPSRRPRTWRC